jgi:intracellular multiplication protein IcmD
MSALANKPASSSKAWVIPALVMAGVVCNVAFGAEGGQDLGNLATNLQSNFTKIGQLMISTAYLAGLGFGIAAIFKFKQHKDNPTQVPIGTPFAMLAIAVLLVFLPGIFAPAGQSIFGNTDSAGGLSGDVTQALPGMGGSSGGGS